MKRLIMLILVLVLALTACQGGKTNDDGSNNGSGENGSGEVGNNGQEDNEDETEDKDGDSKEEPSNSQESSTGDSKYDSIKVSVEEAFDLFMDKYPNAKINEIELEKEDDTYEYEIEGYEGNTQYEMKIDAFTKEILDDEEESESGERGELKKEDLDKIDKYVKEALEDAGSEYWLKEWELKVKSDYVKFDIELKTDNGEKLKYKYDYESGKLIEKK